MNSLWEQKSFLTYDCIIIGAGITGLSAAASLKELDPSLRVAVLEAGVLPTGASTRNAGFACFGSVSELLNDLTSLGSEGMVDLVARRWDGLQKTSQRLGRAVIDLQQKGGYELILEPSADALDQIDVINAALQPLFREPVFRLADEKIKGFGFGKTHHLIENTFEGQLDTGKLMRALWKYCAASDIQIFTGCKVEKIEQSGQQVKVFAANMEFNAAKVAICTNAFTSQLLPERALDITPGRGTVLAVKPSRPLTFEGTFHYDEGYFYFRDYEEYLIFGGGRNLALAEETTTEQGVNPAIKARLLEDLHTILLPNQKFTVEQEWSGVMAFGENKKPIIEQVSDRIVLGARLGGMGVAIGSLVGEEVAELLITS